MKLYICGNGYDTIFSLVAETGEGLASHFCSHSGFAKGDLHDRRPERQKKWKERFGDYEILFLGDDDMTEKELIKRNKKWWAENKPEDKPREM